MTADPVCISFAVRSLDARLSPRTLTGTLQSRDLQARLDVETLDVALTVPEC
jgi:hypothetical protein